jgi:ribosome-binding factor A
MHHQPNPFKDKRSEEVIRELAMKYILGESNGTSLVTVTNVLLENRGKNVTVYFTVLPEDKEKVVLDFLQRKRPEFKEYIKENSRLGIIPLVDFQIDFGEKNRQTVDRLI